MEQKGNSMKDDHTKRKRNFRDTSKEQIGKTDKNF